MTPESLVELSQQCWDTLPETKPFSRERAVAEGGAGRALGSRFEHLLLHFNASLTGPGDAGLW